MNQIEATKVKKKTENKHGEKERQNDTIHVNCITYGVHPNEKSICRQEKHWK